MARPRWSRWELGGARDARALLEDAARAKGESLWNDAWRRLRKGRAAWLALWFLGAFALLALAAPLLPFPSPVAIDLQQHSLPPHWAAWDAAARGRDRLPEERGRAADELARELLAVVEEVAGRRGSVEVDHAAREAGEPSPGTRPARGLGGFADDGWRHRSVLSFAPIGDTEGRRYHVSVPLRAADRGRVDWRESGRRGTARVVLSRGGGRAQARFELELPVELERFERYSFELRGRVAELRLVAGAADAPPGAPPDDAPGDAPDLAAPAPGAAQLAWRLVLPRAEELDVVALLVGGRALDLADPRLSAAAAEPPVLDLAAAPGAMPASVLALADELGSAGGAARLVLEHAGGERVLLERLALEARELEGRPHASLGARVLAALAERGWPAGTPLELAGERSDDDFWDLSALDRGLLGARGALFGLWQSGNWMGTDSKGRDLLARILWGSRTSILVALAAALCSLVIGVTYGALSGLLGGRADNLMMRLVDVLYSLPFIFVVIFLITLVGEYRSELEERFGIDREVVLYVVIGAIYWLTMARVVRGQVLSLKKREFVEAARVLGASTPRVLFAHLVPNVLSIVIVYLTLTIPQVMLFEAFLSFLGLGIEEPKPSWGLLAADSTKAISPIRTFWWLVIFPAAAMGSVLLALNVLGDGLGDALNPKLRGKD